MKNPVLWSWEAGGIIREKGKQSFRILRIPYCNISMREQKEDIYTSYSGSAPQPLQDPPERRWDGHASDGPVFTQAAPQAPFTPPASAGAQPPYMPGGYSNPQYPPQAPPMYGQPQYPVQPFAPGQPPKKKSTGKLVGIVIACIVVLNLLIGVAFLAVFFGQSPEKKIEAYEQSGNLADLIDACDIYDNTITSLDDTQTAEKYFGVALADAKAFHRAFDSAECAGYYDSSRAAYNQLMADWLYLLLQNGQYDKYVSVFTQKMAEYSPSGEYYMDSYAFANFVETDYFKLTDEQKQVTLRAFDALIEISEDDEERRMNLKEYYDFCESLGMYDRADEIERELQNKAINPATTVA